MRRLLLTAPALLLACAPANEPADSPAVAATKAPAAADPCALDSVTDTDGDGAADCLDPCPSDSPDDADGDGFCDSAPAVSLDEAPLDFAIHQRDGDDTCWVDFSGSAVASELRVIAWDGEAWAGTTTATAESDGSFSISAPVSAGLVNYDLHLSAWDGAAWSGVAFREDVACGDLYLVQGQSNAVAADYWGEGYANDEQSPWIRSFGSASTLASLASRSLDWAIADGEGYYTDADVGAWALRMGANLVDTYEIPVGLLNGAVGGTTVYQHQRNDADPADLSTIYGRFLYRARASTFADQARALLWYQGESDGGADGSGNRYTAQFEALRSDWYEDFPALEQLYVVQVRKGCGIVGLPLLRGNLDVREAQRQLPRRFSDVRLMSATALDGHDSCHYTTDGYLELGDRLTRQLEEDFYGVAHGADVDPPAIDAVTWEDATTLRLQFTETDHTLTVEPRFYRYFYISGASVTGASVDGGDVLLTLDTSTTATSLTWAGYMGEGGDLVNANGVGMLTFFDVPITP